MKNCVAKKFGVAFTAIVIFVLLPIQELESLYCHRCLSMDCPGPHDLCESVRVFIARELREFYYIGNYLEDCPKPDQKVQWRSRELNNGQCEAKQASEATCSLGRIRVTTIDDFHEKVVTHATILGCSTLTLLKNMKPFAKSNRCYDETRNGTHNLFPHFVELEHCPQLSDYCTVDYCVTPSVSVVKSYKSQGKDKSFEFYGIIGIIAAIVILFLVIIFASLCQTPLNHPSNFTYSPPIAQNGPYSNGPTVSNSTYSTTTTMNTPPDLEDHKGKSQLDSRNSQFRLVVQDLKSRSGN